MNISENMRDDVQEVLLTEERIKARVKELGQQLSKDYAGKHPIVVCVMKGAVNFFSDLVREIDCQLELEFMGISSYGNGVKTSGIIRISKDIDTSITNRHVIIVEDIIDSGLTMKHLLKLLEQREPASIKTVCLLDKPERRQCDIDPDYSGFTIPNAFVIGYGLDYAGYYRNLKYVGILDPKVYEG